MKNTLKLPIVTFTLLLAVLLSGVASHGQTLPPPADPLLRTAYKLYEEGKFNEALAKCKESISLNGKEYRAYVLLGYIYASLKEPKMASQAFGRAVKLEPKDKEVHLVKAQIDYLRNEHADALESARKAIALDPKYAAAHLLVGLIFKSDTKRQAQAIAAFRTALELNPTMYLAYEDLGELFRATKDFKEAEAAYRKGVEADPKRMSGRFALGRMLVEQGRLKEARELWEGRTSDTDFIMPSFIQVLTRAENFKRARDMVAENPNDPDALIAMGEAVMDGDSWVIDDRQKRAIVLFKKALEARPDYPRAQYLIVKAYIQICDEKDPNIDVELAKLRQLDPKLAAELDQYRKQYQGGLLITGPLKTKQ